ncbi:hypothetical protein ERJ75_001154900 [Trypanosoma vivax]|nr:hypothetical protein ERJ75_001154900 [Trypanosoma vivax]
MDSSPRSGRTPSRNTALRHGSEATNNAEWQQHPRRKDGALTTRRPHRHYRAFRCQETSHARRQPLHRGDCQAPAVPATRLRAGTETQVLFHLRRHGWRATSAMRRRIANARRAVAAGDAPSPKPLPHDSAGGQREATATVSTQVSRPTCSARPSGPGAAFGRRGKRALAPSANTGRTMQIKCLDAVGAKQSFASHSKVSAAGRPAPTRKNSPADTPRRLRGSNPGPGAKTPRSRANDRPGKMQSEKTQRLAATHRSNPFTSRRANEQTQHRATKSFEWDDTAATRRCRAARRAKLAIKKLRPRTSGRTGPCFPKSTSPAEKTLTQSLGNKTKTHAYTKQKGGTPKRELAVSQRACAGLGAKRRALSQSPLVPAQPASQSARKQANLPLSLRTLAARRNTKATVGGKVIASASGGKAMFTSSKARASLLQLLSREE